MKISVEEYCAAAKIVEAYQEQMRVVLKEVREIQSIKVDTLLREYPNMGRWLRKLLREEFIGYYIEEIDMNFFCRQRNAGKKSWEEFVRISEDAFNKRKAEINQRIQAMNGQNPTNDPE